MASERMSGGSVLSKHLERCPVKLVNRGNIDAGAAGATVTPDIDRPIAKYIVTTSIRDRLLVS
jgi:hypothetical protein